MPLLMTRRIALLSDIHGNLPAVEAVINDIASNGVDEVYCLGDLVGYGPDPGGVVDLVRDTGIPTVLGNYDDGVANLRDHCGCHYTTDQARADGEASFVFTKAALTGSQLSWLAQLPLELRLDHEGLQMLLTHGSPRKLNEYLLPDRPDRQLLRLAEEADADVVCVGHVHIPYHRSMAAADGRRVHYVSSGSAGKPKDGDPRACWVELALAPEEPVHRIAADDDAAGPIAETDIWLGTIVHRVEYDIERVATAMLDAGLPATLADALRRG